MPRSSRLLLLACVLMACSPNALPGAAAAQSSEPLVSDRPDFTESASVVGPRSLQLEAGYTHQREGPARTNSAGEVLIRAGLAEWAELRVGLNSFAWLDDGGTRSNGFGDLVLGAKLALLPAPAEAYSPRPQVALLVGTSLPTGSGGFGSDNTQPEAKLALAWSLGDRLALGSNLNYASQSDSGDRFDQFSASVAVGLALNSRLGSYVEYYGFSRVSRDGPYTDYLNGGLTFLINNDLQLDARAGVGLNEPDPEYFLGFGFVLRRGL